MEFLIHLEIILRTVAGFMWLTEYSGWERRRYIAAEKKIKQSFRLDAPYRKLGPWERRFLHICGLFLLVIGFMMIGVKETGMEEGASRIFTGFGCFAVILLEISAVILIHQENQKIIFSI